MLNCSTEAFPTAITYWQRNDGAKSTMLISKSSLDYRLESVRYTQEEVGTKKIELYRIGGRMDDEGMEADADS